MSGPENQPILKPGNSTPLSTVIREPIGKADTMVFSTSTCEEAQDIVAERDSGGGAESCENNGPKRAGIWSIRP